MRQQISRHILRWVSIILVCASSMAFSNVASAADGSQVSQYTKNVIAQRYLPPEDYSLGFLKQMFGSMGGMIDSDTTGSLGGFMMGDMFSVLNSTILIFAIILLMYIVFTATLKTAHEGEMLGRNWSSPWIMIRAAMAMVLLVPQKGMMGYCLAQKLVMMIVLLGVAGANAMWYTAVDKMLSKSTVQAIISQQPDWDNGKLLVPIQAIYQQMACRATLRKNYGNGAVTYYGPFYTYNGRIPNVQYDTALFSVFDKKNIKTWWYILAGANVVAGTSAGFIVGGPDGALYGLNESKQYTKDKHQEKTGGASYVKPNDTNEARIAKPVCGGIWWTIPYYKMPVIQKGGATNAVNGSTGEIGNGTDPNADIPIADIPLEAKIEEFVATTYSIFMYASYNYFDYSDPDTNEFVCRYSTTDIGRKYGCFVQAVQEYDNLVRGALQKAKMRYLTAKDNDYFRHAYVKDADGNKKYLPKDEDHNGVDLVNVMGNLKQLIKKQGWANAGSYFYNIAQLSSVGYLSPIQLNVTPMYITNKKSINKMQENQINVNQYLQSSYQKLNNYYTSPEFLDQNSDDTNVQGLSKRQQWLMRIRGHITFDMGEEQLTGNSRLIVDIMSFGLAQLMTTWTRHMIGMIRIQAVAGANNSAVGMVNPVISLQNLGRMQLDQVQAIWINGLTTIEGITLGSAGLALIPGVGKAATTISQGLTTIVNWLQSIMQPIALMLFASGFLLAVWLPFMPYVLALFCVFGWIVTVVEMMVAAPIVALGILSPDNGHDLLGKGAAAVMLTIGAFLRPMLMILGFIAAMIGIYIASDLINAGFLQMINSVFKNHLGMLTTVGLVSLYALMMTTLCNKSFSMMTVISDRVLRWIGGHNATFDQGETQMLGEAKGAISTTGEKGAQAGDAARNATDGKLLGSATGVVGDKLGNSKTETV